MTNKELEKELKELKAMVEKHIELESRGTVNLKNWNEYDWCELDNIVRSGANLNFKIDNEQVKEIELYTGEKVEAVCYENNAGCMKFACVIDGQWKMNDTDTNAGGYEASKMATVYVPRFKKLMPADMQDFDFKLPEYDELYNNPISQNLIKEHKEVSCCWWTTQPRYTPTFSYVSTVGVGSYILNKGIVVEPNRNILVLTEQGAIILQYLKSFRMVEV